MKKDKQINIRVPSKMYEAISKKAGSEYKEISEVIRDLIVRWLKKK